MLLSAILSILLLIFSPTFGERLHLMTDLEADEAGNYEGYGGQNYIVGGKKVDPVGKYPWQGSMLTMYFLHQCGCVLVSANWAMTAAHCTTTPKLFVWAMFGAHDILTRFKGDPTSYRIAKKIRHADWERVGSKGYPNDIALLQLARPANLDSDFIAPVDLAPKDADFVGSECVITGWGMKRAGNLLHPNTLQEASTTAMNNTHCEARFTELLGPGRINDGHICVGGRGTESGCMGDSGGPLVCKHDGRWVLAGVTSWGMGNCDPKHPSVYTRISYFRDWITANSKGDL